MRGYLRRILQLILQAPTEDNNTFRPLRKEVNELLKIQKRENQDIGSIRQ